MAAISRIGDSVATNHGCDGSTTMAAGSGDVLAKYVKID